MTVYTYRPDPRGACYFAAPELAPAAWGRHLGYEFNNPVGGDPDGPLFFLHGTLHARGRRYTALDPGYAVTVRGRPGLTYRRRDGGIYVGLLGVPDGGRVFTPPPEAL